MTQVLEPSVPSGGDGADADAGPPAPQTTVLRSTDETASRERQRLEATSGKALIPAVIARVGLALEYARTEEAARSGLRYQPVVWTAIAVVAVSFFFPGRVGETVRLAASPLARTPVTSVITTPTTEAIGDAAAAVTVPPVDVATAPTPSLPPPIPAPSLAPGSETVTTEPPASSDPDESPLTVRGSGWAATLSGSPLSSNDVADGTIPVANRLGQVDKVSFVRLTGTATTLELREDAEGARELLGPAAVVMCPIVEPGWEEEPDQSFDDAPTWDTEQCIEGKELADRWYFDLSVFAERSGQNGFAMVPGPDAPADFQITFDVRSEP